MWDRQLPTTRALQSSPGLSSVSGPRGRKRKTTANTWAHAREPYDTEPVCCARRNEKYYYYGGFFSFSSALGLPKSTALSDSCTRLCSPKPTSPSRSIHDGLLGFKQAAHQLKALNDTGRFCQDHSSQDLSLYISQTTISASVIILTQCMAALPDNLDPMAEVAKFNWLLHGTAKDTHEIHSNCGLSRRLLHMISQITYCAARMTQEPENIVVPITASYLLEELDQMRQWSSEFNTWETAKLRGPVIEQAMVWSPGHIINTAEEVTNVTAEAWRLAVKVYLQCRLLRLPRNHPNILTNMASLAQCIRVLSSSGTYFTAQAPLFPVFLLGTVAYLREDRTVAEHWFTQAIETPVRNSIPQLYESMKMVCAWIDESSEPWAVNCLQDLPVDIGSRHAWWEDLVSAVDDICLEVLFAS